MIERYVVIKLEYGLGQFNCPVCAAPVVVSGEGEAVETCDHVLFTRNWVGELGQYADGYAHLFGGDEDPTHEELLEKLPKTAVIFSFEEDARGGGHDGSSFEICIDFQAASVPEEA